MDNGNETMMASEEQAYWANRRTKEEQAEHESAVAAELAALKHRVEQNADDLLATVKEFEGQLVTLAADEAGPECYVRVNVTQNTKGYTSERTVSLRWNNRVRVVAAERDGDEVTTIERFVMVEPLTQEGEMVGIADASPMDMLADLLKLSRRLVKDEIAACEAAAKEAAAELAANTALDERVAIYR